MRTENKTVSSGKGSASPKRRRRRSQPVSPYTLVPPRVLVVDRDDRLAQVLSVVLAADVDVLFAATKLTGCRLARQARLAAVIAAAELEDGSGFDVVEVARGRDGRVPAVILARPGQDEDHVTAIPRRIGQMPRTGRLADDAHNLLHILHERVRPGDAVRLATLAMVCDWPDRAVKDTALRLGDGIRHRDLHESVACGKEGVSKRVGELKGATGASSVAEFLEQLEREGRYFFRPRSIAELSRVISTLRDKPSGTFRNYYTSGVSTEEDETG